MNKHSATVAHAPRHRKNESRVSVSMDIDETVPSPQGVPEDTVRMCAYRMWEAAGRPAGDGVQFWLEAERRLSAAAQ